MILESVELFGGVDEPGRYSLTEESVPQFTQFVDDHETDDYPSGRHRVKAMWKVETKGKKSRVSRVTHHPKTGRPSKPKSTTYALRTKIGLGADGRAYVIQLTEYGQIVVWAGTMKTNTYIKETDPKYDELMKALGAA